MPNRIFLVLLLVILGSSAVLAQKFAYVDTKYILDKVPDYAAAQKDLDGQSQKWQQELDAMYANIEQLYQKYRAEEVLLSEAVKRQRQDDILTEEKKAKEYQRKRFGMEGDLFKLQQEKVKPIQERVYNAIEAVAKERHVNFVLDKAGAVVLLYTDPLYDYSDYVLAKLGINK